MQENKLLKKLNTSTLIVSSIWGMIVSLCLVWGYGLETRKSIFGGGAKNFLIWVALFLVLSFVAYLINSCLDKKAVIAQTNDLSNLKKLFLVCLFGAIIFILWAPAFLAVYPGWFNYDAPWEVYMYREGKITSHHPVIHTLLLGAIVEETHLLKVAAGDYVYNYNSSVALYNVFQMFVCALGLGYQTEFIYERFIKKNKKFIGGLITALIIAFFGLYPPIVMLAMSPTKDVFFGIFYMMLVIKTLKILEEGSKPDAVFTIFLVMCIIYRQNSLYVFILLAIPFVMVLLKKYGRKYCIYGVTSIAAAIIILVLYKGPFYKSLGIKPGSNAEFLSVPSQQIASTYINHKDELSLEERELIEKLFKEAAFKGYRPKLADETKGNMNMDELDSNMGSYVSLYFKLLTKYPGEFFDSFLILNYGLWYPDATMDLYKDGENVFFSTDYQLAIPSSKLPALQEHYMGYKAVDGGIRRVLLMPALIVFLTLFSFLRGCKTGNAGVVMTGLATLLIFATFLLGPCASIRYLFYVYILAPLMAALCIKRDKTAE